MRSSIVGTSLTRVSSLATASNIGMHTRSPPGILTRPCQPARLTKPPRQSAVRSFSSSSIMDDDNVYSPPPSPTTTSTPRPLRRRPLYVSATRQHVGKTTTSLALVSGLQKRVGKIGFLKPVGQQSLYVKEQSGVVVDQQAVSVEQARNPQCPIIACDKDAVLIKQHFQLHHLHYSDMSPVLIPKGYTKDYINGKITQNDQRLLIHQAHEQIAASSDVVLCEGTGHVAVGSVVDASNAQVASWLGARMVLVANAGLGQCLDELELNRVFCQHFGVEIAGVIINKVLPEKYDQTQYYLTKALQHERWGQVPLLGLIPDRPFLGCPAIADLERLFRGSTLVSGHEHRYRHYTVQEINLVATSLEEFLRTVRQPSHDRTLYVSHASRNDILLGFLMEAQQRQKRQWTNSNSSSSGGEAEDDASSRPPWEAAMIVTGVDETPVSQHVLEMIAQHNQSTALHGAEALPPILLVPKSTAAVMDELHRYTPKLNFEDNHRVETAISHYENYIDFELLLERLTMEQPDGEPHGEKQQES